MPKIARSFDQHHKYYEARLGLSLQTRDRVSVCCPFHDDHDPSATLFLDSGGFNCNGCGAKGNITDFEMRWSKCDRETALKNIAAITGSPLNGSGWRFVCEYIYRDREGIPVAKKVRKQKPNGEKTFIWYRRDDKGKWQEKLADDTPRVLYNQPEVTCCNLLCFAEGEGCCDALTAEIPKLWAERQAKGGLRIAVTTNPEGAWRPGEKPKWRPEYNRHFSGKPVVVLFEDNDAPGRTLIEYVAALAHSVADEVRVITFRDQREKYDIADWIEEHSADHKQMITDLQRMIESAPVYKPAQRLATAVEPWPEPEDLGNELPPVPAFDLKLMPVSLRPMVEDVANRMQASIDFPATVAVATLAGVCGRRAVIQPKQQDYTWTVVPNLWGGIVAPPGWMKSPVIACITAPAHAVEAQWRTEYESEICDFKASKVLAELRKRAWESQYIAATKKGAKDDELPIQPDDSVSEPLRKRLLTTDPTFEALQLMMRDNPAGIFVVRDELTGWLAGLERQGREQERSFFLESWNGDTPHTIDRIGRGSIHVEHCCVSLFGGIQPARLRAYLADALRDGPTNDGLIQRFQLLVWPDAKQDWSYQDRPPDSRAIIAAKEVYTRIAGMDADQPLKLKFAPAAQELFVEWITDLEQRLRSDDLSVFMQAHLAKYRSLMPSLALLFSLADNVPDAVGLSHAKQAGDFCDYLELHARRVYASRISPERLAVISLAQKLRKGWKREDGYFSVREVYRNEWSGLGTPDEVRAALRVLEEAGWVRLQESQPETGRPSEIYAINPKIGGVRADY